MQSTNRFEKRKTLTRDQLKNVVGGIVNPDTWICWCEHSPNSPQSVHANSAEEAIENFNTSYCYVFVDAYCFPYGA